MVDQTQIDGLKKQLDALKNSEDTYITAVINASDVPTLITAVAALDDLYDCIGLLKHVIRIKTVELAEQPIIPDESISADPTQPVTDPNAAPATNPDASAGSDPNTVNPATTDPASSSPATPPGTDNAQTPPA